MTVSDALPTAWTELSPRDCEDLIGSCASPRFLYTDRALPVVQPTSFQLDGSHLLFLSPPRFKIAPGQIFSFHVQADDAAWTVMAHGPVDLPDRTPPPRGAAGAERPRPIAVDPMNRWLCTSSCSSGRGARSRVWGPEWWPGHPLPAPFIDDQ